MGNIAGESKNYDENQQAIINQGMRSVKLLTSAIETILDFSRLDSGQLLLEIGEFSVRDLVNDISGMARGDAEKKSLYFHVSVDDAVPRLLLGDQVRLQQILFNIVMNAIKFTETGGVEIRAFSEKNASGDGVLLTFEVRDTGIGISQENMENLFKPMHSGNMAYTRKYGGIGMGLPVSGSLAALMGGKITCDSSPGEGSAFRLTVPLSLPEDKAAEAEAVSKTFNIEALRGLSVLVAEDNVINQMIMEEMLSAIGVKVAVAENGIVALEKLENGNFDIVLMDIQMPEMDGLTAAAQIRADHRYDGLPVLAMTANAGADHMAESINAGMNGHLTKPIDAKQLYKALLKWSKR